MILTYSPLHKHMCIVTAPMVSGHRIMNRKFPVVLSIVGHMYQLKLRTEPSGYLSGMITFREIVITLVAKYDT